MAQLFRNNAFSALAASLTNSATTLTVTTGHGARFPVVASPDFFMLTLQDASNNIEIVRVTARTAGADSMTLVRAQEGTTARAWNIGDVVELRLTAVALNPLSLLEGAATAQAIRTAIGAVGFTSPTGSLPVPAGTTAQRDASPTSRLIRYNTDLAQFEGYNGTVWSGIGSAVNGTLGRYRYIATGGQTTFNGADSNGQTLAYDVGFIDVYLNGVRLDQAEFSATNGASIVLSAGAVAGDEINIVAFGTFTLASSYTKAESDARYLQLASSYTKAESDARYLQLTGGTITGPITVQGITVGRGGGAVGGNSAFGTNALSANTTGFDNTAIGSFALQNNTTGFYNTAIGSFALQSNTTGVYNTAIGSGAQTANDTFSNCSCLGAGSQITGSNQVQLGDSATTTYVYGTVQNRSDPRDKADIRDTILGLDFINALRPIDYRWDMREDYRPQRPEDLPQDATEAQKTAHKEAMDAWIEACKHENIMRDGSKKRVRYHHGLDASQVKAVMDALEIDFGGFQDHKVQGGEDVLSIGYDELIAPLIKAVQQLSAEVEALKAQIN